MKQRRPVIEGSGEVADMHPAHVARAGGAHGCKDAASSLDRWRWTSAWMRCGRGACGERWIKLFKRVGSAAAEQRDRNDKLEDRLEETPSPVAGSR